MNDYHYNGYHYINAKKIIESDQYPFSEGQMRHYLNMRHRNGLDKAVRKVGKGVYLRHDLFEAWIESQSSRGGRK